MAPVDNSAATNMAGFELVCSIKSNDTIPVHKYKSTNTGINVYIAEVEGPVVGGYFCLATEAYDDDGLPHTLEHLVFLGSEKYPYKGVLDLLSNRCLASGTNAWTDKDHTVYTMTTVGSEGFLCLMPIYLEHILYPTLTDCGYLTEVHHITGEGDDAGVVYCEMQNKENNGDYLAHNEMINALYPGKCGYKANTGGALKNLRESTSNEKVRNYHKEFYRPENLTIIITGQVKHTDVFKALRPLEENIVSKGDRGPFTRPWQSPVPPLKERVVKNVYYPCGEEDNGLVNVGWRGPSAVTELYDLTGCSLLLKYLTDNSVSPLQKEFVEIDDPYASNVAYSLCENSISIIYLMFGGVPMDKISLIKDRLVKIIKDVHGSKGIDMKRMKTVIKRHLLETLGNLETMPQHAVAFMLIGDILYGNTKEDLNQRLNQIEDFKKLAEEPESYWLNLMNRYLIEAPMVVINGIPSCEKQKELSDIEKKRVAKQIETLGKEGLEKKAQELQNATMKNKAPIPDEMLSSVPIPGTDSINYHPIKSYNSETSEQHPRFDVKKLPIYTYLDHVNTNFIYMSVLMDTAPINRESRPYLPLLLEAMTESSIMRNGKIIPYEEVVAELEEDTIAESTGLGLFTANRFSCGDYSHTAHLMLQLEVSKYSKGVQWIKELLYDTKFTADRLKIIASKMINDVAQFKKKGSKVTGYLMKGLLYNKDSNHYNTSLLRQHKFLVKMVERLNTEEGQREVLEEIESVRKMLTAPKSLTLAMAVNVDKLTTQVCDVYEPWKIMKDFDNEIKQKLHVTRAWELMNKPEEVPVQGCVLGLGGIDSAYFAQCTKAINDYDHPDLAPLLVCLQYLAQLEGPMWKQIRGLGLSYSYDVSCKIDEGLMYLAFFGATNIVGAYKEAKAIVEHHLKENKWDQLLYESAKSSLIFKIIEDEKSVGDLVSQSLAFYFKNVSHDYNHQMVQRVYAVTIDDMSRVGAKYLKDLFNPKKCHTTLVCHPMKAPEVAQALKTCDHDLKVFTGLKTTYLNDW
ncbi:uncharacterized protein C05D11.1-like [Venturia canescens]|uniref:uncharacterized protein C05D11.1-like n=1 Tax=Venturia canescens TaxID=32260 RepID=UPI001C9C1AAA|nr:uncharacterized protein C05D11.1-like [Venturia canescens]